MSIAPPSSNTTPTRNSGSGYITSTVHQSPFGGVNQWGTFAVAPTFTPSPYIPLQVVTYTPIYTMEVNSSSKRIKKFSGRLGTISLREFKAIFSTVVWELEFKYAANYTEAFAFKQLALDSQFNLCHNHRHHLASCTTNYHCTSWDCAQ
jgi:hypothetical protein